METATVYAIDERSLTAGTMMPTDDIGDPSQFFFGHLERRFHKGSGARQQVIGSPGFSKASEPAA